MSSQDGSAARYHANGVAHAQEPDFIFSPTRPSVPSSQYNTKKKVNVVHFVFADCICGHDVGYRNSFVVSLVVFVSSACKPKQ